MRQATLMKMKPIEATKRASVRRSIKAASGHKISCGAAIQIKVSPPSSARNPRTEPKTVVVDADKVKEWLAKGAQPSDPVRRLFAELGLVERGPIPVKAAPAAASAEAAE